MCGGIPVGKGSFPAVTAVICIKFVFIIALQLLIVIIIKFCIVLAAHTPRCLVILIRTMMPGCFLSSGSFCLCDHKLRI